MADLRPAGRLPLLFFGMLSLLGGVLAGLARLGWEVPAPAAQAAGVHGPLMIAAFFGLRLSSKRLDNETRARAASTKGNAS